MTEFTKIKIREPDDFHVHLREGDMLRGVIRYTADVFARALVMPNLKNPVTDASRVTTYRDEIRRAIGDRPFEPLMTIKLTQDTTPQTIAHAAVVGVRAVKLYPEGVTTNSADGVRDVRALRDTLRAVRDSGLVLCVHAEKPGAFCLDREADYIRTLWWMLAEAPGLRLVVEHVTTQEGVEFVETAPDTVAATITAHHLVLTLDDVVGGMLSPHNFCKPVAKRPEDRSALLDAATSGSPKFFLGTDSAPHSRETKECASGCAGCFTAPLAMPLLAETFERAGHLDRLEAFTSEYGARFYGLPLNQGSLTLAMVNWRVPLAVGTNEGRIVVPFMSGGTLRWKVPEP